MTRPTSPSRIAERVAQRRRPSPTRPDAGRVTAAVARSPDRRYPRWACWTTWRGRARPTSAATGSRRSTPGPSVDPATLDADDLAGSATAGVPARAPRRRASTRCSAPSSRISAAGRPAGRGPVRVPAGDACCAPAASRRMGGGWAARAERLLDEHRRDVGRARLRRFLRDVRATSARGDWPTARRCAADGGRARPPLRRPRPARARAGGVRAGSRSTPAGCPRGWRCFDEAMVGVAAGERLAGDRRARLLHADRGLPGDLRLRPRRGVDRRPAPLVRRAARAWSPFTGQCAVHRGPAHAAARRVGRGAGRVRARGRALPSRPARLGAAGLALDRARRRAPRCGASYDAAEAAYQRAGDHGYDPQPGLALLWLARGRTEAAAGRGPPAARRATRPRAAGRRLLPAAVEVLLAGDDRGRRARAPALELDAVAARSAATRWPPMAAYARGAVELAAGDPAGALPYLRKARRCGQRVARPYEAARVRVLTAARSRPRRRRVRGRRADRGPARFDASGAAPAARRGRPLLTPARCPAG